MIVNLDAPSDQPIRNRHDLGRRLQTLRRQKGISQKDLSSIIGVSERCISSFENAEHHTRLQVLLGYLDALELQLVIQEAPSLSAIHRYVLEEHGEPDEATVIAGI